MSTWRVHTDRGDFVVTAWSASDAARRVVEATFGRQRIVFVRRVGA